MSTTASKSSSKYVDYDEYVDYQLEHTRSEIKWNDALTTLAGIAALVLSYLFLFTVLDHWIIEGGFSRTTRAWLLILLTVATLGWVVWKIVLPWWRKVHPLFAAHMIEEHVPGLKSNLLNLVDLEAAGRMPNPSIMKAMEKRSAVELSKVDMEHVIDRRQLLHICYVLLAVVVLFCLYAVFSPKPISFLRPLTVANVPVATQTRIAEVTPGDATVLARRSLPITAVIRDKMPDRVYFQYSTEDGAFVDERLEMSPIADKTGEYEILFAGENGEGIGQRTTYSIVAGDAYSEHYTIDVQKVPTTAIDRIEYNYPKYMQLDSVSQFIGAIDAWEGTEVVLEARVTNEVPVKSAVVQFLDLEDSKSAVEEVPLTILEGNRLRATWKLEFREDGTYAREYRLVCYSEADLNDEETPTYPITIRPDEAPEVGLVDPTGDLERPANAVIPLVYKARDPDFLLRFVTLRVEKGGEELQSYQLFDGAKKAVADRYRWDLKPLGLSPGDQVTFYLEARDNKQPFGNRDTSPPLNLTITAPKQPEEIDEQLQQEEALQESQLQEEQQQAAEENGESASEDNEKGAGEDEGEMHSEEGSKNSEDSQELGGEEKTEQPKEEPGQQESPEPGAQKSDQNQPGKTNDSDTSESGAEGTGPGAEKESSADGTNPENNDADGAPEGLQNDGTDDAEALEKIIRNQQEEGNQAPREEPQGTDPQEGNTGGGRESPDKSDTEMPTQPGEGGGSPQEKTAGQESKDPEDGDATGSTKDPAEGPGTEKRSGDPNAKGEGTPDSETDPKDATKANDPNNIERKEGTEPNSTPSSDPENPNAPRESTNRDPQDASGKGEQTGKPNDPGAPNQPTGPDRPDPADGDPKGQKSRRPDTGENGASQQTSEGQPGGTDPGNGESSGKPGETGSNPEGNPGGEPGDPGSGEKQSGKGEKPGGKESGESGGQKSSDKSSGGAEGGKGEASESSGEPGSTSGSLPGEGTPGSGGGAVGEGNQQGSGSGHSSTQREQQNLEHAKEAADLVLKRLEQQLERGDVNEELLEELGWTEGQMKAFVDRMRQQLEQNRDDLTAEELVRQRQFEEMLKNTNFQPRDEKLTRTKNTQPAGATRSFGGRDIPVPIEYREAYESFTRELGRKK